MASNSFINSSSADQRWVYQISKIFEEEHVIDINTTPTVCIFGVPKILSATKPEAYSPQTLALGPYHHFQPELYEMERHKLNVAQLVLKMRHSVNVQSLIARLKELESAIRACYHKYIDLDGDSLAWIIAIDGLFLLGILNGLADENHMGYIAGFAGSKLMQDAIHKDVVMLENQIPLVVLKAISDVVHSSSDGKDGGLRGLLSSSDPLGNRGISSDDNVNEVVSGSTSRNGLSPSSELSSKSEVDGVVEESEVDVKDGGLRGLLSSSDPLGNRGLSSDDNVNEAVLGSTIRNRLSPPPKPSSKSEEESGDDGTFDESDDGVVEEPEDDSVTDESDDRKVDEFDDRLSPRVLVRFCQELSPLNLPEFPPFKFDDREFPASYFCKHYKHLLGLMYCRITKKPQPAILACADKPKPASKMSEMSKRVSCMTLFCQCMGVQGAELIGNLFECIKEIIGLVSFGKGNKSNETEKEMKIPSVSELCSVGVKFSSLGREDIIWDIKFDKKAGTLHLPVITLKPTSEVVLRNLVAYEALYKRFPTLGSYMDLMGGIIGTAEDARLLREKDIVEGPLSDGEVADLFNGMSMSKSIVSPGRECNIKYTMELVNKYYNKTWKVKAHRFMKNYVYSFWKGITLLSTIMLVMLLSVQLFCDLNGCTSIYSVLLKEDHAGAYPT